MVTKANMVDNSSDVIRSLRIPHNMRGREAGCNGSIEAVGANVEAYTENNCNAELQALLFEQQMYEKLILQTYKVDEFQKKVKGRIKKRLKENSLNNLLLCPAPSIAVEKHERRTDSVNVNKPMKKDYEEDLTIKIGSDREKAIHILQSVNGKQSIDDHDEDDCGSMSSPIKQDCGLKVMDSWNDSVYTDKSKLVKKSSSFLPPDRVKIAHKKEMAAQQLAVRRMYSAIERQQSRADAERRKLHSSVSQLKNKREQERRIIEEDQCSSIGEDEREEKERWLETIALERRYQKLQKEKEMERFFEALHLQMKEKLPNLPSLCPCHSSLWTSDPNLCARNCQFYRNHPKFSVALQQLLKSVTS